MELLGDVGPMESRFDQLQMVLVSVQDWHRVCAKCTISSEIILDAADGTPRLCGSFGSSFRSVWR
jgi:hypothetical protein